MFRKKKAPARPKQPKVYGRFFCRAWDAEDKEMFYPSVPAEWPSEVEYLRSEKPWQGGQPRGGHLSYFRSKEFPIMQSTGLVDRNGREIYEGDILVRKEVMGDDRIEMEMKIVRWREDYAQWTVSGFRTDRFEVIGNIYENPDLLEPTA